MGLRESLLQRLGAGFLPDETRPGHAHHAAVRSLAYKWIRVLWRCWQDHTVYEEAKYLAALRKAGSPIIPWMEKNPVKTRGPKQPQPELN